MDLRLLALACLGLVVLSACGSPAGSPSRLSGDPAPPPPPAQAAASLCRKVSRGPGVAGRLVAGLTHTQYSADPGGDSRAVAGARSVLSGTGNCLQNQYVMGFGADNPEPSPGVFNFSTLDARLALIRQTGGTPVITLCCSPDWMKGGDAGTTDWSRIDAALLPEHFDDFAAFARKVAQRYPDVRHYQVWSELKGFWSTSLNRWDYEGYTRAGSGLASRPMPCASCRTSIFSTGLSAPVTPCCCYSKSATLRHQRPWPTCSLARRIS